MNFSNLINISETLRIPNIMLKNIFIRGFHIPLLPDKSFSPLVKYV